MTESSKSTLALHHSIREARERTRSTQEEFAGTLGVSPRTIARWEAGETSPTSRYHIEALAQLFRELDMQQELVSLQTEEGLPLDRKSAAIPFLAAAAVVPLLNPMGLIGAGIGLTAGVIGSMKKNEPRPKMVAQESAEKYPERSAFAIHAHVFQTLSNVADGLEASVEDVTTIVSALIDELDKHDLTLDDFRKVLR